MLRLTLAAEHTLVLSSCCAACPSGPAGCCASPPGLEWSDLGRIVALGGAAFLLAELEAGRLRPGPRGLLLARQDEAPPLPRRCVYLGPSGCVLDPSRRAATCNYYLCDDALPGEDARLGDAALRARDALCDTLARWDQALKERIDARFPEGVRWDLPFLQWLGEEQQRLSREDPAELAGP
ncbi:MAG: hypothetical protein U0359_15360 [Byssovorax sp.]